MAERPVFVPDETAPGLVKAPEFRFLWHGGFAASQKKKNVQALHAAAASGGISPLLEVSTKSDERLGARLSAFNLILHDEVLGDLPLESAYQGSKIFETGGPYTDIYRLRAAEAKRDQRLRQSGRLKGFLFGTTRFPLSPETAFYDWLYINAILPHREWLSRLERYRGFTDIEFNPTRSINCQARSCALFVSLMRLGLLDERIRSPAYFVSLMQNVAPEATLRRFPASAGMQL